MDGDMKIKHVVRYYCNFCGRGMCRKDSMEKHERHCTMNIDRKCRLCDLANNEQQSIIFLFGALDSGGLDALRDASGNCPVCIYATLRQSAKFNGKELSQWDFCLNDEMKMFWDKLNTESYQREMAGYNPY